MTQDERELNEGEASSASRSAEVPTCKALSVRVTAPLTSVRRTSFANLDEGAVSEVLTCLPSQASLAVASTVCKPWLGICKSPGFLSNFRRRHPGAGPLLGLFHFSCYLHDLHVTWDAGARSRPDLTVTLRKMEKNVLKLKQLNHELVIVDLNGSWCLLKHRDSNNILFVFDLLTGQSKELRWPPYRYIAYGYMTGFVIDGGDVIFTWKGQPGRVQTDECYICPAKSDGRWRKVQPSCREADAARYAECKHNVVWKKRAGEIIYSLCGPFAVAGWCLAALDTRSMSYSIINLPRHLQRYRMLHHMTVMVMDSPGSLCLVHAVEEPRLIVRGWLRQGEGNAATSAGEDEWKLYRRVELQELASKLAVQLKSVQVVAACAGMVHLRLVAAANKEHQQDPTVTTAANPKFYPDNYYFASLDLRSGEFTNVQPESHLRCHHKVYPFFLPWRAPFLPPAGDNVEAGN